MSDRLPALDRRTYRWLDRATKLLGVLAFAAGLHVGIVTSSGIALAFAGVLLGLCTVPLETPAPEAGSGTSRPTGGDLS